VVELLCAFEIGCRQYCVCFVEHVERLLGRVSINDPGGSSTSALNAADEAATPRRRNRKFSGWQALAIASSLPLYAANSARELEPTG
jgi:hypothetical protein